jgi:hypothetical protein
MEIVDAIAPKMTTQLGEADAAPLERDELTRDPEGGWGEMSGGAVASRLFGTSAGRSRMARAIALLVDAVLWGVKRTTRLQKRWSRADGGERLAMLGGLAFWVLCAAVVVAMWTKANRESIEISAAREYAVKGSCSVCMENSNLDASQPCRPVTRLDFTTHAAKNDALLVVLRKQIEDGHQAITAASAGSRACLLLASHSPSWLPGMTETLALYNPEEVDPRSEYADEAPPPARREQATADEYQPPSATAAAATPAIKAKPSTDAAAPPPAVQTKQPTREEKLKIETVVYEEPSDIYPGVVVERKRPMLAKFRYFVWSKDSELVPRYITLRSFEAACVLHGIEVLNGTHHSLYGVPKPKAT